MFIRVIGFYMPTLYRIAKKFRNLFRIKSHPVSVSPSPAKFHRSVYSASSAEVVCVLRDWGIEEGDTIMVHSSWDALGSVVRSIREFIAGLQEVVGDFGTLCMPAFPIVKKKNKSSIFSVVRTPSSSGIVTEVFRRMPGVKRSFQMKSVASIGPRSEYLLSDHHKSPFSSGETSPYVRFGSVGAKILCLGVPPTTNTMFHCGEDVLKKSFPVWIYPPNPSVFPVLDENGQLLKVECFKTLWKWNFIRNSESILKYFNTDTIEYRNIFGIESSLTYADKFLSRLLNLAYDGIHIYRLKLE